MIYCVLQELHCQLRRSPHASAAGPEERGFERPESVVGLPGSVPPNLLWVASGKLT